MAAPPDQQTWSAVDKADVVYIGETHDDPSHHEYELQVVRGLLGRKIQFAIGWEMFDETQQGSMDAWAAHRISLEELLAKTDFQKRWGTYSPVYEQILRTTERTNVRNLALNAPPELARKIARGEPLTAGETEMLPSGFVADAERIRISLLLSAGIRESRRRTVAVILKRKMHGTRRWPAGFIEFKRRHPNVKLVVLTGRGHVFGGYGIPSYVRQKADLKQLVLFPSSALVP